MSELVQVGDFWVLGDPATVALYEALTGATQGAGVFDVEDLAILPQTQPSGGAEADTLRGTQGDDVVYGDAPESAAPFGGPDVFYLREGDDLAYSQGGDDRMYGMAGNDTLFGSRGSDILNGGDGDDALIGGGADDLVIGGAGNDLIFGGDGFEDSADPDGDDTLQGGQGSDSMYGRQGNDLMDGGADDDVMAGGDGNDTILGKSGHDILSGEGGDDEIEGGFGADVFLFDLAAFGNDTITDFTAGEDVLCFAGLAGAEDALTATAVSGGLMLTFDDPGLEGSVLLQGVETLAGADLLFL